jgi:hypothetical protein
MKTLWNFIPQNIRLYFKGGFYLTVFIIALVLMLNIFGAMGWIGIIVFSIYWGRKAYKDLRGTLPSSKPSLVSVMPSTYATRLKAAYTIKFGYPDPSFEKEVDRHVKALEVFEQGRTRRISEEWLKRMAKFVEVPWYNINIKP